MHKVYIAGAAGMFVMGQQGLASAQGNTPGDALLDAAMTSGDGIGAIVDKAAQLSTLGISQTDAAIIIALAGVAWKFLDTQQKGGTFDTLNLWLRRKLRVDPNQPPPPIK